MRFNYFGKGAAQSGKWNRTRRALAVGLVATGLCFAGGCAGSGGDVPSSGTGHSESTGAQEETKEASGQADGNQADGSKDEQAQGGGAAAQQSASKVVVQRLQMTPVTYSREWPASTKSGEDVDVHPRVQGILENFNFKEGETVQKDQVLFTLEDDTYKADLQSALANQAKCEADLEYAKGQVNVRKAKADLASAKVELNRAQQDVDRYKPLVASGTVARQTLDNAIATRDVAQAQVTAAEATLKNTELSDRANIDVCRAQLESAKASVTQARLNLGYCVINSPISGIIGKLNVHPGNLVGKAGTNETLVTLSRLDPIYVNFSLSEQEYLFIFSKGRHDDSRVHFNLVLADGSVYKHLGHFGMLDRSMDSETATIGVRIVFPNPETELRDGQFGRLRISLAKPVDALVIPQRAVITEQSDHTAYVVGENNIVERRSVDVEEGVDVGTYIVHSGLKEGDLLVVDGIQKVAEGSPCEYTELNK